MIDRLSNHIWYSCVTGMPYTTFCAMWIRSSHITSGWTQNQKSISSHALLKGRKLKSKEEHEERYKKYDQQQLQICFWWTVQIHLSLWSNTSRTQLVTWKTISAQNMAMLIEVDVHTLARLQEVRATLYVQSYMFVLWYSKILLSKKLLRAAWLSSKVSMRERCGTHCLMSSLESWRRLILSFSIGLYVLRTEQRPVEANRGQVRHVRLLEFSAFPILLYSCGLTKENVLKGR